MAEAKKFIIGSEENFGVACFWGSEAFNNALCAAAVREITKESGCRVRQCREKRLVASNLGYGPIHDRMYQNKRFIERYDQPPPLKDPQEGVENVKSVGELYVAVNMRYRKYLDEIQEQIGLITGHENETRTYLQLQASKLEEENRTLRTSINDMQQQIQSLVDVSRENKEDESKRLEDELTINTLTYKMDQAKEKLVSVQSQHAVADESLMMCGQTVRDMLLATQLLVNKNLQGGGPEIKQEGSAAAAAAVPVAPAPQEVQEEIKSPPGPEVQQNENPEAAARKILEDGIKGVHVIVRVKCDLLAEKPPTFIILATERAKLSKPATVAIQGTKLRVITPPRTATKETEELDSNKYSTMSIYNDNADDACRLNQGMTDVKVKYDKLAKFPEAIAKHEMFIAQQLSQIQQTGIAMDEDLEWKRFVTNTRATEPMLNSALDDISAAETKKKEIEEIKYQIGQTFLARSALKFLDDPSAAFLPSTITIVAVGGSGSGKTTAVRTLLVRILNKYLLNNQEIVNAEIKVQTSQAMLDKKIQTEQGFDATPSAATLYPFVEEKSASKSEQKKIEVQKTPILSTGITPVEKAIDITRQILKEDEKADLGRKKRHTPFNEEGSSRSIKIVRIFLGSIRINIVDTAGYEKYDPNILNDYYKQIVKAKIGRDDDEYAKELAALTESESEVIDESMDYISFAINEAKFKDKKMARKRFYTPFMNNMLPSDGVLIVLGLFKSQLGIGEQTGALKTIKFLKNVSKEIT